MNPTRPPVAQTRPAGLGPAHARAAPPPQPPAPGTAGVEAAQAAAKAAAETAYQAERAQALSIAAAALLLADTFRNGLFPPGEPVPEAQTPANQVKSAFDLAEAFIAEAEKRLGGKLPL
jgi:hypothetical protein